MSYHVKLKLRHHRTIVKIIYHHEDFSEHIRVCSVSAYCEALDSNTCKLETQNREDEDVINFSLIREI